MPPFCEVTLPFGAGVVDHRTADSAEPLRTGMNARIFLPILLPCTFW